MYKYLKYNLNVILDKSTIFDSLNRQPLNTFLIPSVITNNAVSFMLEKLVLFAKRNDIRYNIRK